jgi:hypothetical protein
MGSELLINDLVYDDGSYWRYSRRLRGRGSMHTELDGAMKVSGVILEARKTGHLATVQEVPERRRVQLFRDEAGGLRVENDLGVPVIEALYVDAEGNNWISRDIAPGSQGILEQSAHGEVLQSLRAAAGEPAPLHLRRLMERLPKRVVRQWRHQRERLYLQLAAPLYKAPAQSGEDQSPPVVYLTTSIRPQSASIYEASEASGEQL